MPTIKIPRSLCVDLHPDFELLSENEAVHQHLRQSIKAMIQTAIDDRLEPARLPNQTEAGVSMNISFAAAHDKAIRRLAKVEQIREGDAALKFLYSAISRGDLAKYRQLNTSFLNPYIQGRGLQRRVHQEVFAHSVLDSLQSRSIGMIEAATGVGKTLGIIAGCAEMMKELPAGWVVVAVPTIQLLYQFAREHRALEACADLTMPTAHVIVGRNEFVDVQQLREWLQTEPDAEHAQAAQEWLDGGGLACGNAQSLTTCYLLASLLEVAPSVPVDLVRLGILADPDDPGYQAYHGQFAFERECDPGPDVPLPKGIIYCTHAMLAIDTNIKMMLARRSAQGKQIRDEIWGNSGESDFGTSIREEIEQLAQLAGEFNFGLLPNWKHVVIDEAHLFEQSMANVMSEHIALARYMSQISQLEKLNMIPASHLKKAKAAMKFIMTADYEEVFDLNENSLMCSGMRSALDVLAQVGLSIKDKGITGPGRYLALRTNAQAKAIEQGLRAISNGLQTRAYLTYSPIRKFAQFYHGRKSVERQMRFLWATALSGVCVSATLYIRRLDKDSASYSASVLAVPQDRVKEYPVIRPDWIFKPVQSVYIPEYKQIDNHVWLRPPTRSDKLDAKLTIERETIWLDEVAHVVSQVYSTAQGGTLVLLNSYHVAHELNERLSTTIPSLVVANSDTKLQDQVAMFTQAQLTGNKTLWLAVGGAWTGVDINGSNFGITDPAEDNLLTDLIIVRLPFGMNRTITHQNRMERMPSVPWELLDTTMRFKQGLGRLVRTDGLPANRRIWMLDGRINDPGFINYLSPIHRVLGAYPLVTLEAPGTAITG